jgi:hypothetical protein
MTNLKGNQKKNPNSYPSTLAASAQIILFIRNAENFQILLRIFILFFNGRTIFWAKESEESFWKVQSYFILFYFIFQKKKES